MLIVCVETLTQDDFCDTPDAESCNKELSGKEWLYRHTYFEFNILKRVAFAIYKTLLS